VPCADLAVTFVDVARVRWRLVASVRDPTRRAVGESNSEVDLRAGIDKRTFIFLDVQIGNFDAAWSFAAGATCASLHADSVEVSFEQTEPEAQFSQGAPCDASRVHGYVGAGSYLVRARAFAFGTPVAVSGEPKALEVTEEGFADAGTLVLSPCSPCTAGL